MELTLDQALQKGIEAQKAGKAQEAEQYYKAILKAQPKHADANHNMGVLAFGVGKVTEALPFFKTALEANPSAANNWLSYISVLIKLDRMADAKAVLEQAKKNGAKGDGFDKLEQKLKAFTPTNANSTIFQDRIKPVINLYTQGQLEEALSEALKLLLEFPESVDLYNLIGAANKELGRLDKAIEAFTKVHDLRPDIAESQYNIGIALRELGKPEEAIEAFKKAISINSVFFEAHNIMGATFLDQGKVKEAINVFKKLLSLRPDYFEAHYNMGIALKEQGKLKEAIKAYNKSLSFKPDFPEAYNNLGITFKEQGKLENAIESYNKALSLRPDYVEVHYNMGVALKEQGKLEEAIGAYEKALSINPDYLEAFNQMGNTLQEQGKLEDAIEAFIKVISIKPDYAEAYNNMGNALEKQGRHKEALEAYNKATTIKPGFTEPLYNMALLLYELGQYKKAASLFKMSDSSQSQTWLLKCLYELDSQSHFYDQLDYLKNQGQINAIIGSYSSRSKLKYGIDKGNPFCNEPLNYVLKINLAEKCNFESVFVRGADKILSEGIVQIKRQDLILKGSQTAGNVFGQMGPFRKKIQDIIQKEVDNYRTYFKESNEGLINSWPPNYKLDGWIVKMKTGGAIKPHMHEQGWISGSVYINVPPKLKADSGNLVVCVDSENDKSTHSKSIDVVTGSLCLFPSSLLHYTIPFEADEDRIVMAFDVVPE